jgi:hypothetical protein
LRNASPPALLHPGLSVPTRAARGRDTYRTPRPFLGQSVTTWTSRRHSRHTSIIEKSRLPAAFRAFPFGHSLPFPLRLLLEPLVNEGTH